MNEVDSPVAAPRAKRQRRQRERVSDRSIAAQTFLDIMKMSPREVVKKYETWFVKHGVSRRSVNEFLSGKTQDFSNPDLLRALVLKHTGETHDRRVFVNAAGVENYLGSFCRKTVSAGLLRVVSGTYRCIRPGTDVIAGKVEYRPDPTGYINELNLKFHGDFQPGTFSYVTKDNKQIWKSAWHGYVVAKEPHIYLFGFCEKGEDASYFIFRREGDNMLVGIQSLLLSDQHAVSRHIVAIRADAARSAKMIAAAHDWIRDHRLENAGGLLVNLAAPPRSEKT